MRPDLVLHAKAGLPVAVVALIASLFLIQFGLRTETIGILLAGGAAAAAVEFAQGDSNKRLRDAGMDPIHDVSGSDLLASFAPAALLAVGVEFAARMGFLP